MLLRIVTGILLWVFSQLINPQVSTGGIGPVNNMASTPERADETRVDQTMDTQYTAESSGLIVDESEGGIFIDNGSEGVLVLPDGYGVAD